MKRINFAVDEETHKKLKVEAAVRQVSLKDLFMKAVKEYCKKSLTKK